MERWEGPEFLKRLVRGGAPVALPALTTAMVRKEAWRAAGGFDGRLRIFDTASGELVKSFEAIPLLAGQGVQKALR